MKKLWFKRKEYGWGWVPASWEGWVVILAYSVAITALTILPYEVKLTGFLPFLYFFLVLALTSGLIFIAYKTGESPRWQWGNKKSRC